MARRDEIQRLVTAATLLGYEIRFGTFTVRHSRKHDLANLLGAVHDCWAGVTSGAAWTRAARAAGLVGQVRVTETKYGHANGWHPHVHVLFFFRPGSGLATRLDAFGRFTAERWRRNTIAAGLPASAARAARIERVTDDHLDRMAGYVTKVSNIAAEMTAGAFKSSREHWTPEDLVVMGMSGVEWAWPLFREYEAAIAEKHLYQPLHHRARAVLAEVAIPLEDRPPLPVEQPEENPVTIPPGDWRAISRERRRDPLMAVVVDSVTPWDVVRWLDDRGLHAAPARRDGRDLAVSPDVTPDPVSLPDPVF